MFSGLIQLIGMAPIIDPHESPDHTIVGFLAR